MALIDCELRGIEFDSVEAILLVEMEGKAASYEGYMRELGRNLREKEIPVFYVMVKANLIVCWASKYNEICKWMGSRFDLLELVEKSEEV